MNKNLFHINYENFNIMESKTLYEKSFPINQDFKFGNLPYRTAHGHAIIKNNLIYKYNEEFIKCEDGLILKEILFNNKDNGIIYCDLKLSNVRVLYTPLKL